MTLDAGTPSWSLRKPSLVRLLIVAGAKPFISCFLGVSFKVTQSSSRIESRGSCDPLRSSV